MVAAHRQRPFPGHQLHAQVQHRAGLGAIADQVAQQRELPGALRARVR